MYSIPGVDGSQFNFLLLMAIYVISNVLGLQIALQEITTYILVGTLMCFSTVAT